MKPEEVAANLYIYEGDTSLNFDDSDFVFDMRNAYVKGCEDMAEKAITWLVKHECFGCEDSVLATNFRNSMLNE